MTAGTFSWPDITVFVTGAFAGAIVAGLAGFAFGLIAAAIWLQRQITEGIATSGLK